MGDSMKITLSIRGEKYVDEDGNEKFDWKNALIDAGIIACLTFFSTLAGTKTAGLPDITSLYSAFISSMVQFFSVLAIKRGIIKKQ